MGSGKKKNEIEDLTPGPNGKDFADLLRHRLLKPFEAPAVQSLGKILRFIHLSFNR
jgi:hypothetical protein